MHLIDRFKRGSSSLALALCIALLFGCAPEESAIGTSGESETTVLAPFTAEDTEITSEQLPPAETTPASTDPLPAVAEVGAVLIGGVGRDARGFFITLSSPMNVEVADGGTRDISEVRLYDRAVDGISKVEFFGSVVTVIGRLTAEEGSSEPYIHAYGIAYGYHAEGCATVPELREPSFAESIYDPSLPPAEEIAPRIANGSYTYDPHVLSLSALQYLGNDFAAVYIDFIDAYLNYETSMVCESEKYAFYLPYVLEKEFPLYGAEVELNLLEAYDPETKTLSWSYSTSSRAEHDALVANFIGSANVFLADVDASMTEKERAMKVYNNITRNVRYDYSVSNGGYEPIYIPSYRAYSEHTGLCWTFARTYVQMLTQVGISAEYCCCDMKGENVGHAFVLVTIDGEESFCDPTYELSGSGGLKYLYFGMSYSRRLATDHRIIESTITIGTYF